MSGDPPYDATARRDTPLALKLKARIRAEGPITVAEYMHACLQDTEHGYYRTKAAIGRKGDFITAPEISQVFGELIGLWCVIVWRQMGEPAPFNLIELGPGRGTLMHDALRAAHVAPAFLKAASVHLVESSEALRKVQAETLNKSRIVWHEWIDELPSAPSIVIANEFLDTFPIEQLSGAKHDDIVEAVVGLKERIVASDTDGRLVFAWRSFVGEVSMPVEYSTLIEPIHETQDFPRLALFRAATELQPLAALFIDYGHAVHDLSGDTLQAVRAHTFEHPLCSPGEADLSVQVNFADLQQRLSALPALSTDGPITQSEFLGNLGIMQRASRLMAANPAKANEIETGVARLMAPNGMGTRFKVLGVRSKGLPPLPGFPTPVGGVQ